MRLLVRHAHAGHKRHWSGPDAERPLSIRGWAQAEGLLATLADLRVERLLTSPSLRCRQTLLPLAAALDLELASVDDLGTDGDLDRLVDLLAAGDSDGAVLCTHGEVLGELFARLRARGDIPAESRLRCEKGSTWVLEGPRTAGCTPATCRHPRPVRSTDGGGRAWGIRTRGRSRPSAACLVAVGSCSN
jgi:phosphohistidine phosphatase SixA